MKTLRRNLLAGWQVVILEDEADNAEVASRILSFYGADVQIAPDGQAGLELIKAVRPMFVICDLSMPVMDGWAVIKAISNDRTFMDVPVVALTAHAMNGDREKALAAGFHNYLTKPLTVQTFIRDLLVLLIDLPQFAQLAAELEEPA